MLGSLKAVHRRPLFQRRAAAVAMVAAVLSSVGLTGIAQATWFLGGTWGAYDEEGNELNLPQRDVFGSDGVSRWLGGDNAVHVWVGGLDGVSDDAPHPTENFINQDPFCDSAAPRLYYSNDPGQELCWERVFSGATSDPGPWGVAFPIVAKGLDDSDLVFDHWEIIGSPDTNACFTGEVGIPRWSDSLPVMIDGPDGDIDSVFTVGFKAFIDHSPETGFSGFDFTANAIYAPLTPDTSAPVVTIVEPLDCSIVELGSSVIASFSCVDPGDSDPSPACVGDVANGTSVDTSTPGEHELSVTGTDATGNTRTRTIRYTVVDTTDPSITITSPAVTSYLLNQSVAADYKCSDAGGVATCSGPVLDGVQIDTASIGSKVFTVNAEDDAGNTASATVSYSVDVGFAGFQQPIDVTALNVAKAGKTVPVKWRLVDANGLPVLSWPSATITATSLACSLGSSPDQIEEYAAGASGLQNLGNGYYQFNWATPKSYANSCKTLHLSLGDGADHTAQFQFTK
jgi:hypothetical protein